MTAPSAFGSYRVLHQIGSGVLGPVFRCHADETLFAVKAIKLDLVPEVAAQLAETLRALTDRPDVNAAIATPVDAGVEGGTPYLVYAYESGDGLDVFLRQSGSLNPAQVRPLLTSLAQAIDSAWDHGVGHGTLHPRDVFVGRDLSDVRVSGFGVAQALESIGVKPPCRRPYAAPERISGVAWDRRADIYSFAAIVQELLNRHSSDASAQWRETLAVAMAESPDARFNWATEFVDALYAGAPVTPAVPAAEVEHEPVPELQPAPTILEPLSPLDELRPRAASVAAPALDFGRPSQPAPIVVTTHAPFPWAATIAVAAAGMAIGVVGGYELGYRRAQTASVAQPVVAAVTPSPSPIAPALEPIATPTPLVEPPPASQTAVPTPVPSARGERKPASTRAAVATSGAIDFDSRPRGAAVTVDGRARGVTPLLVEDLSPGFHSVLVKLAGHKPVTTRVSVAAGEPTPFRVSLEQLVLQNPRRY